MKVKGRSPSHYDRWSVCTASPEAINADKGSGLIASDRDSSLYDQEGTAAHALMAISLDLGISPREFMGDTINVEQVGEWEVDAEMGEEVDRSVDYIRDFITPGSSFWVEQKLSLDRTLPGVSGFGDAIVLSADGRRLHVFDLKYGKGHHVEVEDNNQEKLYGLGAMDQLLTRQQRTTLEDVMLHVVQPRTGNIDSWVISKGELERFRVEAHGKYQETFDPERRRFVPGLHCWYCDRRPRCIPLKESLFSMMIEDPEADAHDAFKNPDSMSDQELAELFPYLSFISSWASNVRKFMEQQALDGKHFKGLKLVEGKKGARQWKDESKADHYLEEKGLDESQRYKRTLQTPNQAEQIIGRKNLDESFKKLYTQPEGKVALTTEDDPRPAYTQKLADEFDD